MRRVCVRGEKGMALARHNNTLSSTKPKRHRHEAYINITRDLQGTTYLCEVVRATPRWGVETHINHTFRFPWRSRHIRRSKRVHCDEDAGGKEGGNITLSLRLHVNYCIVRECIYTHVTYSNTAGVKGRNRAGTAERCRITLHACHPGNVSLLLLLCACSCIPRRMSVHGDETCDDGSPAAIW